MKEKVIHTNKDYYQAIVQIRPAKQEVVDFIADEFKHESFAYISKIVELKTGLDYYLSDRHHAAMLAKKLKKKFKAKVTVSRSLFTQDHLTSKLVYRMTYCLRF